MPNNLLITDYCTGHMGSVRDSSAFHKIFTFKEHEKVFGPDKWMWADSAYPSELWCVVPFKHPIKQGLDPDQRTFNYHLSKVSINHT